MRQQLNTCEDACNHFKWRSPLDKQQISVPTSLPTGPGGPCKPFRPSSPRSPGSPGGPSFPQGPMSPCQEIRYRFSLQAIQCWYTFGCFICEAADCWPHVVQIKQWFLKLFVVWTISDVKTQERCCDHWPGLLSVQVGLHFLSGQGDPDESKVKQSSTMILAIWETVFLVYDHILFSDD